MKKSFSEYLAEHSKKTENICTPKRSEMDVAQNWTEDSSNPTVAIRCLTYNHSKYIKDALDGFLMQQTNFPFWVCILDDASTDGTRDILEDYMEKYPSIFKCFLLKENTWGKPTRHENVKPYLEASQQAKYIAICEGDDYWTDPTKLQKQIDFLENNNDFSMCFHRVKIMKDGEIGPDTLTNPPQVSDIRILAKGNYIHSPSAVYRNYGHDEEMYEVLRNVTAGDYVRHMFQAKRGKIFCFDDEMAVYRMGDGEWTSSSEQSRRIKWLRGLEQLLPHFSVDVQKNLRLQMITCINNLYALGPSSELEEAARCFPEEVSELLLIKNQEINRLKQEIGRLSRK